jgi:catechol 2,3-dioxygenase-like lactoylglutathione lyase family enzyme
VTPAPRPRLTFVNVFARDLEALAEYYRESLDLEELEGERSAIYRAFVVSEGCALGFHAWEAYEILGLTAQATDRGVRVYLTFDPGSDDTVGLWTDRLLDNGGHLVKAPHRTAYGAWMAAVLDPEENVVRCSHLGRPFTSAAGVST